MNTNQVPTAGRAVRLGRLLGPLLAVLCYALLGASDLDHAGRATAATGVLMAAWWLTEALPLPATALLPIVAFPLLGIASAKASAAPYASDIIFLFMGGFVLGLAMERWNLHQRIALHIILKAGTAPARLVAGFMIASAFLSLWISNTATTVILVPVGLSIVDMMLRRPGAEPAATRNFATCIVLAIAYAASIGGSGTLIGSPPNLVVASYASEQLGCDITMFEWMRFGIPLVLLLVPVTWLYLVRLAFPLGRTLEAGDAGELRDALRALGPMSRGERTVAIVFTLTALAWIFRPQIAAWSGLGLLNDTVVAMLGALVLFLIPARRGVMTMDWDTALRLPWGVLLLFGGGLSLAAAISEHGVDRFLAGSLSGIGTVPLLPMLALVAALVIFSTELTSNTALATALVPVLVAVAAGLQAPVTSMLISIGLGASYAFMMPVATPPNAIAFASGHVTVARMARTGLALNLMSIPVVTIAAWLAGPTLC